MYGTINSLTDILCAIVYAILFGVIAGKLARWHEFWAIFFMGVGIWFMIGSTVYQAIFFPSIPLDENGKPIKLTKE